MMSATGTFVLKSNNHHFIHHFSNLVSQRTSIMLQIIIALLISTGQLSSAEQWESLSPDQQSTLVGDLDTIGG